MKSDRDVWLNKAKKAVACFVEHATGLKVPDVEVFSEYPPLQPQQILYHLLFGGDPDCMIRGQTLFSEDLKTPLRVSISPRAGNAVDVLGVLIHELTHCTLGGKVSHGPLFAAAMKRAGMVGQPESTEVGQELEEQLKKFVLPALGPMPPGGSERLTVKQVMDILDLDNLERERA